MRGARACLAGVVLLFLAAPSWAQPFVGRGGFVGGTLSFNRGSRLALSINGGYGCGYGFGGYGCGFGGFGCGPGHFPGFNSSVTIIAPAPQAPQVVMPPPLIDRIANAPPLFDRLDDLEMQQARLPPAVERPAPGEMVGGFRPIPPGNREQARQKVPPAPPPKKEEPPKPPVPPPQPKPGELPPPPRPDPDPKVEYQNQLRLGQEAFALARYGLAAQRFRLAIGLAPDEPLAHFLLAQALFAVVKYDEAVDEIREGLRRQPDWPVMGFRPLRLYEGNVADYPDHLLQLEMVLSQEPDNPVFLFLYGYQLWFDGRQEEAVPYFERAAPRLPDRGIVDLFLKHRPAGVPMI